MKSGIFEVATKPTEKDGKAEKVFPPQILSRSSRPSWSLPSTTIAYAEKVSPPGNIPNNPHSWLVQCTWKRQSYFRQAEVEVEMSVNPDKKIIHLHCWQNRFSKSDPRFVRLGTYTLAKALELCRTKFHLPMILAAPTSSVVSVNSAPVGKIIPVVEEKVEPQKQAEAEADSDSGQSSSSSSETGSGSNIDDGEWRISLIAHGHLENKSMIGLLELYLQLGFEFPKSELGETGKFVDFDMAGGTRMHGEFVKVYHRVREQAQVCPLFLRYKYDAPDRLEI